MDSRDFRDAVVLVCLSEDDEKNDYFQEKFGHRLGVEKYLLFFPNMLGIRSLLEDFISGDEKTWNRAFQPNILNFVFQYI